MIETKIDLSADVPLDAFVRRISRIAEKVFNDAGEISPGCWFAVTADGDSGMIATPVFNSPEDPYGDRYKSDLSQELRQFFKAQNVIRCAYVAEAWSSGRGDVMRPSLDPQREEIVAIMAEDRDGTAIQASRRIVRPAGGKPYLDKLEFADAMHGGRFIGMLSTNQPTVN